MFFLNATLENNKIQTPDEAVFRAFRILNQFDIPEGSVVEPSSDPIKPAIMEATSWTSMSDLRRLRYYYHTMQSRTIRMIDLGELCKNHGLKVPSTIELPDNEQVVDVTGQFKSR
jgi:choloylglycine hydrolase